ncbi:hypothetical protein GYMLUDRAFT_625622 [Collybiopsis luxurians FD-317 M1]|nr:hypothetical protein GYMLUDRAFT_625622 [Collybiopsis luxurians FD-317 M1]
MQPLKPKMRKVILTGFVACMSLFGLSSGAPVSRTPRPAEPSTNSAANPPCVSSASRQTNSAPRSDDRGRGTSTSAHSPTTPLVAPPRPSSSLFSLGFSLGPIDYAAAGIARRVSRIFVKRMSAQSGHASQTQTQTQGQGEDLVPVIESESNDVDPVDSDRYADKGPILEDGADGGEPETEDRDLDEPEGASAGENGRPEARACRWGCI